MEKVEISWSKYSQVCEQSTMKITEYQGKNLRKTQMNRKIIHAQELKKLISSKYPIKILRTSCSDLQKMTLKVIRTHKRP